MTAPPLDKRFYEVRPTRVALDISRAYAFIVLGIYLALRFPHSATWLGAILLIGSQQYALQIILHDGLHGRLLSPKGVNDLLCRLFLCYPLFTTLQGFRTKHISHHRFLGTNEDPDRYYHVTKDKNTKVRYLLFITAIRSGITTINTVVRKADGHLRHTPTSSSAAGSRKNISNFEWLMVGVVQSMIAVALTIVGYWYTYFLFWMIPFSLGVYATQNLRSFAEHAHPELDHLADKHRDITYVSNQLERIFFAPCNMNYHAEHHIYPAVAYYHLPSLREYLEKIGAMRDVEYRKSYLGFAIRYWRALPVGVHSDEQAM